MWYQYKMTLAKIHKTGQIPSRLNSVIKALGFYMMYNNIQLSSNWNEEWANVST